VRGFSDDHRRGWRRLRLLSGAALAVARTEAAVEESLSDLIKQKEELEHQQAVLEAMSRIIDRTPGATTLEDVEQQTGRSSMDLLVEETGLTPEQINRAAENLSEDEPG
jgi:hypothetical protein